MITNISLIILRWPVQFSQIVTVLLLHRGPTDVEDDRPPHPKMARAISASGLCVSIVTFHALKCWLFACKLTYKVHMNGCVPRIYGK